MKKKAGEAIDAVKEVLVRKEGKEKEQKKSG